MSQANAIRSDSDSPVAPALSSNASSAKDDARERRRSQVRRAQRAYRSRKESAITNLDHRVKELEGLFRAMQVTCSKLDYALQATSSSGSSMPSVSIIDDEEDTQLHMTELKRLLDAALPDEQSAFTQRQIAAAQPKQITERARSVLVDDRPLSTFNPLSDEDFQHSLTPDVLGIQSEGLMYETSSSSDPLSDICNMTLPPSMTSVRTYSYQERSFARRLHRMCIERAVEFLSYPGQHPKQKHTTFKLAYSISNRGRMLSRLRCRLHRGADEVLENYEIPFFKIGGAGSYSAWKKATTDPVSYEDITNDQNAFPTAFGPYTMPVTEATPTDAGTTLTQLLQAIGFGGAWYDVADVEDCLKTNGITIGPQDAFISIDMECLHSVKQDVITLCALHDPHNISQQDVMGDNTYRADIEDVTDIAEDWTRPSYGRFWGATGTAMSKVQPKSSRLVLDVDRFASMLVDNACCLGRAPGFRLTDFWNALLSSTH